MVSSMARVREWHGGKLTRPRGEWNGHVRNRMGNSPRGTVTGRRRSPAGPPGITIMPQVMQRVVAMMAPPLRQRTAARDRRG